MITSSSKSISKWNFGLQIVAMLVLLLTIAVPNILAQQLATFGMFLSLIFQNFEKRSLAVLKSDGTPVYVPTEVTPSEEEQNR